MTDSNHLNNAASEADRSRVEAELFEFLSIPSVSTDPERTQDTRRAALWLRDRLEAAGLSAQVFETARHPVVYAEHLGQPGAPTVLVYGHYDVQPAEPLENWTSDPFTPIVRDGQIVARGASDDKGQVYAHVKAAERLIASNTLAVNLKFLVEGEEEIGSPNLEPFIEAERERLACDVVVISDGSMFAPGVPTLTTGLRGLAYLEVHVQGAVRDLHSGGYGGAVANPINALCTMLAALKDEHGRILVPGVYDKVRDIPEAERESWRSLPFDEAAFARALNVDALPGEQGFSVLERLWARPTLDVNGIWGGFSGAGSKTVLPARAGAKLSLRLVPDQDPVEIAGLVKKHLESLAPQGVTVEVVVLQGGQPVALDPASPPVEAARRALARAYPGKEARLVRGGGTIPVVATFELALGAPVLLVDLGLPDDGAHGPDEHFSLENYHNGILVGGYLLEELAKLEAEKITK